MNIRMIASAIVVLPIAALGLVAAPAANASTNALASCTGTSWHDDDANILARVPTIGNDNINFNCVLGVGNDNPAVGDLQNSLNACYGAGLAVDNNFGPKTKAALEVAQAKIAVTVDGVYGPQTRDNIHWEDQAGICAPLGYY